MTRKILIADDEGFIRLLIRQALEELEDAGVELLNADNGVDALDLLIAERPALAFIDVMMPRLNGFEVCRQARRNLPPGEVFIVLLTAKGQEDDLRQGQEAGADLYMTKPFDPDELLALARRIAPA